MMVGQPKNKWLIGAAASVIAFLVAQAVALGTFAVNARTERTVEMIRLAKDLTQDFYKPDEKTFKDIRMTIEACKPLYAGYNKGGKFNRDDMNRYLGFFDDLGFYVQKGALDLDMVDQFFGAYIIEAYEYNEVREYIRDLRGNFNQKRAFGDFEKLAITLEAIPEHRDFIETFRLGCHKTKTSN